MSKITKDDIDWDNFPAYIAGETKPKVLTEEEKDQIVDAHNNAATWLANDPSIIKRSSMTTQGRIQSGLIHPVGGLYRNVECNKACRKIW